MGKPIVREVIGMASPTVMSLDRIVHLREDRLSFVVFSFRVEFETMLSLYMYSQFKMRSKEI